MGEVVAHFSGSAARGGICCGYLSTQDSRLSENPSASLQPDFSEVSTALRPYHDESFPGRFVASHVENGLVTIRTMRLTPIATLVVAVLLGALLWLAAPAAIGRALKPWEALVCAVVLLALLEWLRVRSLRREREQTESLRDSALW